MQRSFVDFDDFWGSVTLGSAIGPLVASLAPDDIARIKKGTRTHLRENSAGRLTYGAWANAIKGRVPGK